MSIVITPEQQSWIDEHVASGEYRSAADAVRQLLDERIAERRIEDADGLAWAKPLVDAALDQVSRGEVSPLEAHEARMRSLMASLKE